MLKSKFKILLTLFIVFSPFIMNAVSADQETVRLASDLNAKPDLVMHKIPFEKLYYDGLAGKWDMVGNVNYQFILEIQQSGNQITGTMTRTNGVEPVDSITGTSSDNGIKFTRSRPGVFEQVYTGGLYTTGGPLKMTGTFSQDSQGALSGGFSWNASKQDNQSYLRISSDPVGGEVLVDGISQGFVNPTLEISLKPGTHAVLYRLDGYRDSERTVNLISGENTPVSFSLVPSTGNISVTSDPSGAEVLVDGVSKGFANPTLDISGLNPGQYKVICRLADYKDFDIDVTVEAGVTTPVPCSLVLLGEPSLSIVAEPARIKPQQEAQIFVNVTGPDGSPLSQAEVMLTSAGGYFNISAGKTDSLGRFSSNFTADKTGNYVINASVKTNEPNAISSEVTVAVSESDIPIEPTGYDPSMTSLFAISMMVATAGYLRTRRGRS
jgi:hypothetical protein